MCTKNFDYKYFKVAFFDILHTSMALHSFTADA